ncbi:MAG TPA: major capsid protein, partial [Candidatus Paceibacterota bacterium]|nr:major capsid protein [Candidatus Paceibacterota bacterium]
WYQNEAKVRAPATESAGGGFEIDNTPSYFCPVVAFHKDVDEQLRGNCDPPIDPDRDATLFVSQKLLLKREVDWASAFFTTGVWTGSTTATDLVGGVGFTQWGDNDSTPLEDVTTQIIHVESKTGFRPNKFVCSPKVMNALKQHPSVLDRIKYTSKGVVTADLLASLLGVDEVLEARAVKNSAAENGTESTDFIMGANAMLCYAAPSPSILAPTAGYTFTWTGLLGAGAYGNRIKKFPIEAIEADRIEGEMAYAHAVVASELGVFFSGAFSAFSD